MNRGRSFRPGVERAPDLPAHALSEADRESAAALRVAIRALHGADREDRDAAERILGGRALPTDFELFAARVKCEAAKMPKEVGV